MNRPQRSETARARLYLVLALLVVGATFASVVQFPFVNYDDALHLTENELTEHPLAHGWTGLLLTPDLGYAVPGMVLMFAAQRALFGLDPHLFHAVGLLMHLVNVALVFVLARRLGQRTAVATGAALLFGLHPLVAEPVSWVTGQKDLFLTGLVLAAALVFLGGRTAAPTWRRTLLASALALAATLVKPSAVTAAALLWVLARTHYPTASRRRLALSLLPLAATSAVLVALGVGDQHHIGSLKTRDGAGAVADVLGALWLQLSHLALPVDLSAFYYRSAGDPPAWTYAATVVIVLSLGAVALLTPPRSMLRTGLAFAALAFLPASNVLASYRWTADSYVYLPLVGVALAVPATLAERWPATLRPVGAPLAAVAFAVYALLAHLQSSTWSSSVGVWSAVVTRYPDNVRPLAALALAYRYDGRLPEAAATFVEVEQRFPVDSDVRDDEAWARTFRGEPERARALIERGVFEGNPGCIREFWKGLLASPELPAPSQRDLVAAAFDHGFEAMKVGLHDARRFRQVAAILSSLGLDDRARLASAEAARLSSAAQ